MHYMYKKLSYNLLKTECPFRKFSTQTMNYGCFIPATTGSRQGKFAQRINLTLEHKGIWIVLIS